MLLLRLPPLDLPPPSALNLPDGSELPELPREPPSHWRLEMEALIPHERQSMMADSEDGPALLVHFEAGSLNPQKLGLLAPPDELRLYMGYCIGYQRPFDSLVVCGSLFNDHGDAGTEHIMQKNCQGQTYPIGRRCYCEAYNIHQYIDQHRYLDC